MNSNGSFLYTVLERVRMLTDDASLGAKYDNDYLIRHVIGPATADVLSRINLTNGGRIVLTHDITLEDDVNRYRMPPCCEQILRLVTVNDDGVPLSDLLPQDLLYWSGKGWAVEGVAGALELYLENAVIGVDTVQVWYVPNGDFMPQLASGTLADQSGTDRITLSTTSTLGQLDRRDNAYAGQVVRLLPASPGVIEERIVQKSYYSGGVWYLETRRPFVHAADGTVTYELAPAGSSTLYDAISYLAAMKLGAGRKITQVQEERLKTQYLMALKTISDRQKLIQSRKVPHIAKNTVDNREYTSVFGFLGGP